MMISLQLQKKYYLLLLFTLFGVNQFFCQCWSKVSMGNTHCVAMKSDGRIWSWGSNYYGQIGDASNVNKSSPTPVGTFTDWNSIDSGHYHAMALKNDGSLWAWGSNYRGELGLGFINGVTNFPQRVGSDNDWTQVSGGEEYTMAIKNDGTLWAWGYNNYGQTGTLNVTNVAQPYQVGSDSNWSTVSAGFNHSVAIKTNGTLWAWGNNGDGQLGDGTNTDKNTPVQIGTNTNWTQISSAAYFTVALKADGTLWTWGNNSSGQLGDGTNVERYTPMQIGFGTNWSKITTGIGHVIALKTDGTLWSWGLNLFGQLGDGTTIDKSAPTQIGTETNWVEISANGYQTITIKNDGAILSWGKNDIGQLGNGTTTNRNTPTTIGVCLATNCWNKIECGTKHSLAIKNDGSIYAWGYGDFGNLGTGNPAVNRNVPNRVGIDNDWMEISAGDEHSLGIKTNGTIWSWGHNLNYVLGYGPINSVEYTPRQIGTETNWSKVSAGNGYTMAIKSNGTLWGWGNNGYGQLGNGTINTVNQPTQIGTAIWSKISAKYRFTVGLKTNGTLWAWGDNSNGQLGDGTTISNLTPRQIGTDTNWSQVSTGIATVVALKNDGTLWAWGRNSDGELGDGTLTDKYTPIQIGTSNNWVHIAAGDFHCLALKNDDTLWAWGFNNLGQVGIGNNTPIFVTSPVRIGSASNWDKVACGREFSTIINNDSNLFTYGFNGNGQLGDSTYITRFLPNTIPCDGYTLGTNQLEILKRKIKIYPNPSDNIITIESFEEIYRIELFDIQGRLVNSELVKSDNHRFSVTQLTKGTYILRIHTQSGIQNSKIIKK